VKLPWSKITSVIENERLGIHGTFRGNSDGRWMGATPGAMEWQRSGEFARGLAAHGVRSVVVGDLTQEWYLYALSHDVDTIDDIRFNLVKYYPEDMADAMLEIYKDSFTDNMTDNEVFRLFGEILSAGQVHLPVRLLHRDLLNAGFPVARYEIRWTPEQVRPPGNFVTHATDRPLWTLRKPILTPAQLVVARAWIDAVDGEVKRLEAGGEPRELKEILALREDQTIVWTEDGNWDKHTRLLPTLPGEV